MALPRYTRAECFAMLKVKDGASIDVVKKAFRALALVYHPDKAGAAGTKKFQKLLEAYVILVDGLSAPPPPPPPGTALGPAAEHPVLAPPPTASDTPLRQDIPEVLKHGFITLSRSHFALATRRTSAWNGLDVICDSTRPSYAQHPSYEYVCEQRNIYDQAFDRLGLMINGSSDKLSKPQKDTSRHGAASLKLAMWSGRRDLLEANMLPISQEMEELRNLIVETRKLGRLSRLRGGFTVAQKLEQITTSIGFMVDHRLAPALAHDGLD